MMADLDRLRALGHGGLRRVARGEIVSVNGVLRHHTDVLPPDVITTLKVLQENGFVTLSAAIEEQPDRQMAELTLSGVQLLDRWNKQAAREVAPADGCADGVASSDPVISGRTV